MIKKFELTELDALVALALRLWGGHNGDELRAEFEELLSDGSTEVFLLYENGAAAGFAQCSVRREYVEGTHGAPVGYLEGIFVDEGCRRRGCAAALVRECERWAALRGCTEFASDCALDNEQSRLFHLAMGFGEAARLICFVKKL